MSTEREELMLRLAGDIADGRTINWAEITADLDDDAIARLRDIALLAGQFEAAKQLVMPALPAHRQVSPKGLWAHLELIEEIGRGSSGVVYRAFDPMLQRAVALKLCNSGTEHPDDLLREARQMARVDHPGVLKIHGAALVDGQVGFWSDLVAGESLADRLVREPRLAAGEAVSIALEVCVALAAIHQADLVHGDVKAQNVVRDDDGQHILIDFGSARHSNDRSGISGTPSYLPPERLSDCATSQADDLYSLGVLLFRMLSGSFPVQAESFDGLLQAHAEGRRNHLIDLMPRLDGDLISVVERAVHPQPERRYASAGALAAALRACLPGVTAAARAGAGPAPAAPLLTATRFPLHAPWLRVLVVAAAVVLGFAIRALWSPVDPAPPFQARLLKASAGVEFPLLDGDQVAVGDTLALDLELPRASHVYVLNEDAAGAVYQLFPLPMSDQINPLPAGQRIRLPGRVGGRNVDWQVTSAGSRERFYVLVSQQPINELASAGFALAEAGRPLDRSGLIAHAVTRGVGGLNESSEPGASARYELGTWLQQLTALRPDTRVQRFELHNP